MKIVSSDFNVKVDKKEGIHKPTIGKVYMKLLMIMGLE